MKTNLDKIDKYVIIFDATERAMKCYTRMTRKEHSQIVNKILVASHQSLSEEEREALWRNRLADRNITFEVIKDSE